MIDEPRSDLTKFSDSDLLQRFIDVRDQRAFAEIVRRHGPMVKAVCRRRLARPDADDAFQATFLTLVQKAKWIRSHSNVAGWLSRVAVRASIDLHRSNQRRQMDSMPDPLPTHSSNPGLALVIEEEMERLPANYRAAIVLFHIEGHSIADAAQILGVTRDQVSAWLRRGRAKLKQQLQKHGTALSFSALAVGAVGVPDELVANTTQAALQTAAGLTVQSVRAASLAQGILSTMIWNTVMKSSLIILAALGSLAFLKPMALETLAQSPATYFEDFTDGSGDLAPWAVGRGETAITPNGLDLTLAFYPEANRPNGLGTQAEMSLQNLQQLRDLENVSVRVQFGMTGDRALNNWGNHFGVFAGNEDETYFAAADASNNELYLITYPGFVSLGRSAIPTGIDLLGDDDMILQLDAIDGNLELYAWSPGDPKPNTPQLSAVAPVDVLYNVGVGADFNGEEGFISLRNIAVAEQSIVPEPFGLALAASGGLMVIAFFQIRRQRR